MNILNPFRKELVTLDEYARSTFLKEKRSLNTEGSMDNLTRMVRNLGLFVQDTKTQLVPSAINNEFFTSYLEWLLGSTMSSSGKVIKKPYINSTALHQVDLLKNLVDHVKKRAAEKKLPSEYLNIHVDVNEVKKPYRHAKKGESDVFFPSYDEIMAIYNADLPKASWKALRDAYVLGFFTCARHSDIHKFRVENITKVKSMASGEYIEYLSLKYYSTKTKSFVEIELDDVAMEIINRWSYWRENTTTVIPLETVSKSTIKLKVLLKYMSQHSDLKILKDLGNNVIRSRFRGREQITTVMPKYEAYTFHTSRHGGACWLLDNDVSIYDVSKMLGHMDIKTTEKWYAKSKALTRNLRIHQSKKRALNIAV